MKNYLNRYGNFVEKQTDIVEVVGEIPDVEDIFVVSILNENKEVIATEEFDRYPNKNQIMWCILKHKGEYAEVHRFYYLI